MFVVARDRLAYIKIPTGLSIFYLIYGRFAAYQLKSDFSMISLSFFTLLYISNFPRSLCQFLLYPVRLHPIFMEPALYDATPAA
jgi:hypothetical protein